MTYQQDVQFVKWVWIGTIALLILLGIGMWGRTQRAEREPPRTSEQVVQ